MTQLTSAQLALLRDGHPHYVKTYISIMAPATVWCGTVSGLHDRGARTINVYNISGTFGNILPGQTLLVGTDGCGSGDLFKLRVKDTDANRLVLGENDIEWVNGMHVTVLENYELHPVIPLIEDDDGNFNFYKDYDVSYTDENEYPPPIAIAGPPKVGFLTDGSITFALDASSSYAIAYGASISSYLWACTGGGSTSIASAASPTTTLTVTAAGTYWLSLTVTDDNGKSQTTRRPVFVHERSGANAPYRDYEIDVMPSGSWDMGGWEFGISVHGVANESTIPDEAMVVLWCEPYFNGSLQYAGGLSNSEHVLMVGYVRSDTIEYDFNRGTVSFTVSTIEALLRRCYMYSISLQDVTSPTTWYEYYMLTAARAVHHLWRWHSTLFDIADVFLPISNTDRMAACDDFVVGDLYTQADTFIRSHGIMAHVCCNKYGQVYVEQDIQSYDATDRAAKTVTMAITVQDWQDALYIRHTPEKEIAQTYVSGVAYDGAVATPYMSVCLAIPDRTGVSVVNEERYILPTQARSNEVAGRLHAMRNNPYKLVRVKFAGNYYGAFDVVPQEWCTLTLVASDTPRGIEWDTKRLVIRRVLSSYKAESGTLYIDGEFEAEAFGQDGVPVLFPTSEPDTDSDYVDGPPEPSWVPSTWPSEEGYGDGADVYILANPFFISGWYEFDSAALAVSARWTREDDPGGSLRCAKEDPFTPDNAYCISISAVYKIIGFETGAWASLVASTTIKTFLNGEGYTNISGSVYIRAVHPSYSENGLIYLIVTYYDTGTSHNMVHVIWTDDDFSNMNDVGRHKTTITLHNKTSYMGHSALWLSTGDIVGANGNLILMATKTSLTIRNDLGSCEFRVLHIPRESWNYYDNVQYGSYDPDGSAVYVPVMTTDGWQTYEVISPDGYDPDNYSVKCAAGDGRNDWCFVCSKMHGTLTILYDKELYIYHAGSWTKVVLGDTDVDINFVAMHSGIGRIVVGTGRTLSQGDVAITKYTDDFGSTMNNGPLWRSSTPYEVEIDEIIYRGVYL